jgi:hypothetical protein
VIATQIFPIRARMKWVDTTAGPGCGAAAVAFVAPESLTGPAIELGAKGLGVEGLAAGADRETGAFGVRAFPAVRCPFLLGLAAFPWVLPAFIPAIAAY